MNIENLRQDLTNAQRRINEARLAVQSVWTNVEMPNGELDTSIYLLTEELVEASEDIISALEWLDRDEPRPPEGGNDAT